MNMYQMMYQNNPMMMNMYQIKDQNNPMMMNDPRITQLLANSFMNQGNSFFPKKKQKYVSEGHHLTKFSVSLRRGTDGSAP